MDKTDVQALVDRLRNEIHSLHDVSLQRDDPIFVSVTLHRLAVEDLVERMEAITVDVDARTAAAMNQSLDQVRDSAAKTISVAADAIAKAAKETIHAETEKVQEAIRSIGDGFAQRAQGLQLEFKQSGDELGRLLAAEIERLEAARKKADQTRMAASWSAMLSMGALVGIVLVLLLFFK